MNKSIRPEHCWEKNVPGARRVVGGSAAHSPRVPGGIREGPIGSPCVIDCEAAPPRPARNSEEAGLPATTPTAVPLRCAGPERARAKPATDPIRRGGAEQGEGFRHSSLNRTAPQGGGTGRALLVRSLHAEFACSLSLYFSGHRFRRLLLSDPAPRALAPVDKRHRKGPAPPHHRSSDAHTRLHLSV